MNFGEAWMNANPDDIGGNQPPEPGLHDAALVDTVAAMSKRGSLYMRLTWQRVEDRHQWDAMFGLGTPTGIALAKREARELGIDIDTVSTIEQLDAALATKRGGYYRVSVEQNGDYTNTYVRGVLTPEVPVEAPAPSSPTPAAANDDVPF